VPNRPFILCLFPTLVLFQARVVLEMLGAACTNALESFLGHLTNFCERHRAGGALVIHLSRKLFESYFDRFRRTPLREHACILMPVEVVFPIERVAAIANQFHSTLLVVLLAGMSGAVIRVGKRFAAEAAQDSDVVLPLLMVHQSVLAHKRRLFLRAEIAGEAFAMSVLDVLLQFLLGLVTNIALLAPVGKASLAVDVEFRLTRKFLAAFLARHWDGLRAFLIRTVRHGV